MQVARGRPLPAVVYVQMDDKKLDTTLFPDAIVPFTPQKRHITSTHGGKNIISRYENIKIIMVFDVYI